MDAGRGESAHGWTRYGQGPTLEPDPIAVRTTGDHLGHSQGSDAGAVEGQSAEPEAVFPQDQLGDAVLPAERDWGAQDARARAGCTEGGGREGADEYRGGAGAGSGDLCAGWGPAE